METIVGKILCDRYRIVKELSKNEISTLFDAEDFQQPHQPQCEIERLQPQYDSEVIGTQSWQKVLQAFITQGDVLKNISQHPQIPQLLDFFECDRHFYLVREVIDGENLATITQRSLLTEAEAIAWLQEILGVLDFIHQANVIHLNIQPCNLVQQPDGKKFLTNFSNIKNAVLFGDRVADIGDRNFISLEQQEGKPNFSTDIYALGKTIIYALTGKISESIKPRSSSLISSESSDVIVAEIRPELADILNKMVSDRPEKRYQSATEIIEKLNFGQQVVTLPPPVFNNIKSSEKKTQKNSISLGTKIRKSFKIGQKIVWSLLALPFFIAAIITYIGINKNSYKNFETYINNNYQFKIKYPQTWSQREVEDPITGEIIVFVSPFENSADQFLEKVYIAVEYLPSETNTLEEYTQIVFERIEQAKGSDVEIYQERKTRIAQSPARMIVYSRQEHGLQLRQMEAFTIRDDQVYVAIYTAERAKFSKFLDTAKKMIDSWEIE